MSEERIGVVIEARDEPGVLHELTGVIARRRANIASVEMLGSAVSGQSRIYFELERVSDPEQLLEELRAVPAVLSAAQEPSLQKIYGKRIIIMGGGAQVGQVAIGAISEADRHNIRGEHISVDTIPSSARKRSRPPYAPWRACRARKRWCWPGPSWAERSKRPSERCGRRDCWWSASTWRAAYPRPPTWSSPILFRLE